MNLTSAPASTEERRQKLEEYMADKVLADGFLCRHYGECKDSHAKSRHAGDFFEGQLHHLGRFYDLLSDDLPLRVVVVGQEYGEGPSKVRAEKRYNMVMASGLDFRFKAAPPLQARNPHMRGTTNVLRLLFGLPLGTDHDSEFMNISGERVHLFDAFSLVNYFLCSAVGERAKSGRATPIMKRNCQDHFREVMRILEPSVILVQGKGFWPWVKAAFDSATELSDPIYRMRLGTMEVFAAVFTHPSTPLAKFNWGVNCQKPYLLETVAPAIERIRTLLLGDRA